MAIGRAPVRPDNGRGNRVGQAIHPRQAHIEDDGVEVLPGGQCERVLGLIDATVLGHGPLG